MIRFWLNYILFGLAATAAIHFAVPLYREYVQGNGQPAAGVNETSAEAAAAVNGNTPTRSASTTTPRRPVRAPGEAAARTQNRDAPAATNNISVDEIPAGPNIPIYTPPAPDPDAISWGVLVRNASHRGLGGNNLGRLDAGTVMSIQKLVPSDKGDAALGLIDTGGDWKGPALVGLENLLRFDGSLDAAPTEAVGLLCRYYQLRSQVERRRGELRRQRENRNPYNEPYRTAAAALRSFDERVIKLTKQRDEASGVERGKLIDTLHGMKSERTRLRLNVEESEKRRKGWDAQNPEPATAPVDKQLEQWQNELARLGTMKKRVVQ